VMFAPEDLDIVKGAPGIRRRFMDMEIAQVEPRYLYHLTRFQKVLQQRNLYLKQQRDPNAIDLGMLEVWDRQLAEHGSKIMKKRQNFISKLQIVAAQIHDSITEGKERLKIVYQPSVESEDFADETVLFERFMLKLSQIRMQEIRRGITLAGPHRDDILFYINDKEAGTYGSQGQQRTTALSVKLAEIELMKDEIGEYPVLLLDDVLSELDRSRQMRLIETFKDKVQTFITATEIDSIDKNRLGDARIFRVVDGRVLK
jgi:DNA replication and repair protein RecF